MTEAYIVDAVRTPVGRRGGGLAALHPADLAAVPLRALVERTGIDPAEVGDVIFGCIDTIGGQAADVARTSWLAAGLPTHVPGTTIDRQCGSSQQAIDFAAQGIMAGVHDLVVAGGVQHMSSIPMQVANRIGADYGYDDPWSGSTGWTERFGHQEVSQFVGAELLAQTWDVSRDEMEVYAVESHTRALDAWAAGSFDDEITPVGDVCRDEGPRQPDLERMRALPPLRPGGRTTAAVASQIGDGAAALLLASPAAVERYGLIPLASVRHMTVLADDPVTMLSAPIPATRRALERSGLSLDEIDLVEINEAFAVVPIAWERALGADPMKVNVNGGAIALGHPLGATGARLMTTLVHELRRSGGRYALQTMCELGGQANVTIIEAA